MVAFWARAPDETASREGRPPLALDVELTGSEPAAELIAGERLYREGRESDALQAFEGVLEREPESLEAAVGSAISRWPAGTTARLRTLAAGNETSGLVHFHLGFALFWEQREQAAINAWQEALNVDPDSPSALRSENLLFPDMPRGRPIFVPSVELDPALQNRPLTEQLAALELQAREEGTARSLIAYGVGLQRAGRAVSAGEQFEQAARVEPNNAEARTAAAIGRFEKSDPTPTFAALGGLTTTFPEEAVVRYHLALALIWINDVEEARNQLAKAAAIDGDGFYEGQAVRLLDRLDELAATPSGETDGDGPS